MAPAVREGHVFKQPQAIHQRVTHLLEMRDQVDVRKPEAPEPALVLRVPGLSGQFRVRVHVVCAVHTAGAAAHHHAVKAFHQLFQADFVDEAVLRGHVPAAKDYPVRPAHQFRGLGGIPPV